MFVVLPMDEARRPFPCRIEFGEAFDREFRPVFGGAEHSFGMRIVVADVALNTDGSRPGQCSMTRTVVPFKVAPLSPCKTGLTGMAWTPSMSAVRRARCAA